MLSGKSKKWNARNLPFENEPARQEKGLFSPRDSKTGPRLSATWKSPLLEAWVVKAGQKC